MTRGRPKRCRHWRGVATAVALVLAAGRASAGFPHSDRPPPFEVLDFFPVDDCFCLPETGTSGVPPTSAPAAPEPSTLALGLIGGAAAGWLARRARSSGA